MRKFEFAMQSDGEGVASYPMGIKQYDKAVLPTEEVSDFRAAEDIEVPAHFGRVVVAHTGVKAKFLPDEVLLTVVDSTLARKGVMLANQIGIYAADYGLYSEDDGEISFLLVNYGSEDVVIHTGDVVGRGVFVKRMLPDER